MATMGERLKLPIAAVAAGAILCRMRMTVRVCMSMFMSVIMLILLQENFPGKILFTLRIHINLCGRDSTAGDARDFEARADIEGSDCVLEQFRRHSGIHQGAEKHVAADARKAV